MPLVLSLLRRFGRVKALERTGRYVNGDTPPVGHPLDAVPLGLDGLHFGGRGRDFACGTVAFVGVLKEAAADHLALAIAASWEAPAHSSFAIMAFWSCATSRKWFARLVVVVATPRTAPPGSHLSRSANEIPHSWQTYWRLGMAGTHYRLTAAGTPDAVHAAESEGCCRRIALPPTKGHTLGGADPRLPSASGNKSGTAAVDPFDNLSETDSTLA